MKQSKPSKAIINQLVATTLISSFLLTTSAWAKHNNNPTVEEEIETVKLKKIQTKSLTAGEAKAALEAAIKAAGETKAARQAALAAATKAFVEAESIRRAALVAAGKTFLEAVEAREAADKTHSEAQKQTQPDRRP